MQTRTACPACQTVLSINAAYGDGAMFRCPECGFEFALRLQPQTRSTAPPVAAHAACHQAPPSWPNAPQERPAAGVSSSGSLLWVVWAGIGVGAFLAAGCILLTWVVLRNSAPAGNPGNEAQNIAQAPSAANSPSAPAPSGAGASGNPPAPASPGSRSAAPTPPPLTSSPPNSVAPLPTAAAAPAFAYRFNNGEQYAYSFTAKADVAGATSEASGTCTLTLSGEAPPPEFSDQEKSGQGSGSGFVVASDGYIVTCAHVVEESTKIEVILGTQSYPAQVIAFDKAHDLAVVRIAATNLPTVSLADSDAVELGQEVRAVGFPLSNLLGESVKITRGTIAGMVNTAGHKLFQVDASINPGNSGGPLVNEMGQVVGVASAKLTGADIDGVGFAVPASDVFALLRSQGISPAPAGAEPKLDGTALARRVTPAVAMIKVTIGPEGFAAARRFVLGFSGQVTSSEPHAVGHMQFPGIPDTQWDHGKLLVSERGELLAATGNVQIPYLLGPLGSFALDPLPDGNQRTWRSQRTTTLTQIVNEESESPFPMRFRPRGVFGNPFGRNQTKVVTPAMETSEYELTGVNGDLVSIAKRYAFQTLQSAGTQPAARITGEGAITFNRAKGCAERMEYKATLVRTANNVSVSIPVAMQWRRLSQGEVDAMQAQAQANLAAAQKAAAERKARELRMHIGQDTEFAGGPGGGASRFVEEDSLLYGVECRFAEWLNEECVQEISPLFARDEQKDFPARAVAREGYAVGAINVNANTYLHGVQLIFMRIKDDGRLDPNDTYSSEWLGVRASGTPRTLTGDGAPIIGIHVRKGLIVDAIALVVKRDAEPAKTE